MIFGKVPEPGRTKTRLEPAVGREGAARLYEGFLDDTVRLGRQAAALPELWLAGADDAGSRLRRRYPGVRLRRQPEGGLGDRLRSAFEAAFEEGASRAVAVGSDHPTLPGEHLEEAFEVLERADACVGPTPDGGYWGVGLRRQAWPRATALFEDVPWSTGDVLRATLRRAEERGLRLRRVSRWYDVDEPADLERLRRDVGPDTATAAALADLAGADGGPGRGPRTGEGEERRDDR